LSFPGGGCLGQDDMVGVLLPSAGGARGGEARCSGVPSGTVAGQR